MICQYIPLIALVVGAVIAANGLLVLWLMWRRK